MWITLYNFFILHIRNSESNEQFKLSKTWVFFFLFDLESLYSKTIAHNLHSK